MVLEGKSEKDAQYMFCHLTTLKHLNLADAKFDDKQTDLLHFYLGPFAISKKIIFCYVMLNFAL